MTERTKIFTVAHVPPPLEKKWLQHLRDFDVAHPGCHFEVIADVPDRPLVEIIKTLQIEPGLSVIEVMSRKRTEQTG